MQRPGLRVWWSRLTLRWKTLLVAGIPMLVLVLAVPLLYSAQRETAQAGRAVEHSYRVRQDLAQVLQDLVDAETGVRGYLLTADAEFLTPYGVGIAALPRDLDELERLLSDASPATTELVDRLGRILDRRLEVLEDALRFAERTPAGSIPEGLLAEGRALTEQIRDLIGGLDADQVERLDELRDGLDRAQAMSLVLTVVVVPFALFGTLIAVLLFTTGLVRGVKRIEANAVRMETGEPLLDPPHGTDELARLGQALLHTAARVAEQDAELRELALEDPLTGLRNRRAFLQIAEHELQVALRRTSVTALLFFDIDGLKAVNDNLGHAEGDRMLQGFAEVLRTELRASDLIARIGGDEFCVLLSRDTAMDGGQILERLERAVAKRNDEPGRRYRLAFSVGVAFFDPSDPVEVERLLEEADAAMYEQKRAKRAGHAVV